MQGSDGLSGRRPLSDALLQGSCLYVATSLHGFDLPCDMLPVRYLLCGMRLAKHSSLDDLHCTEVCDVK